MLLWKTVQSVSRPAVQKPIRQNRMEGQFQKRKHSGSRLAHKRLRLVIFFWRILVCFCDCYIQSQCRKDIFICHIHLTCINLLVGVIVTPYDFFVYTFHIDFYAMCLLTRLFFVKPPFTWSQFSSWFFHVCINQYRCLSFFPFFVSFISCSHAAVHWASGICRRGSKCQPFSTCGRKWVYWCVPPGIWRHPWHPQGRPHDQSELCSIF